MGIACGMLGVTPLIQSILCMMHDTVTVRFHTYLKHRVQPRIQELKELAYCPGLNRCMMATWSMSPLDVAHVPAHRLVHTGRTFFPACEV